MKFFSIYVEMGRYLDKAKQKQDQTKNVDFSFSQCFPTTLWGMCL